MKSLKFYKRKIWFFLTRFPDRRVRVKALRHLGYSIGEDVYIAPGLTMAVGTEDTTMVLNIGDRVAFGPNVTLILASHPDFSRLKSIVRRPKRQIIIGHDTWIGANVVIMPDIVIGKYCIIGAGAVVTHNIPDYSVVGGVPAKFIKKLDSSLLPSD